MGRYDGEDYEDKGYCAPGRHKVARNGNCWNCHHQIPMSDSSPRESGPFDPAVWDELGELAKHLDAPAGKHRKTYKEGD